MSEAPRRRTPSEVLLSEFLWTEKSYAAALARRADVPRETAEALLDDLLPIDDELAERLGAAFGTPPCFWLDLQRDATAPPPAPELDAEKGSAHDDDGRSQEPQGRD